MADQVTLEIILKAVDQQSAEMQKLRRELQEVKAALGQASPEAQELENNMKAAGKAAREAADDVEKVGSAAKKSTGEVRTLAQEYKGVSQAFSAASAGITLGLVGLRKEIDLVRDAWVTARQAAIDYGEPEIAKRMDTTTNALKATLEVLLDIPVAGRDALEWWDEFVKVLKMGNEVNAKTIVTLAEWTGSISAAEAAQKRLTIEQANGTEAAGVFTQALEEQAEKAHLTTAEIGKLQQAQHTYNEEFESRKGSLIGLVGTQGPNGIITYDPDSGRVPGSGSAPVIHNQVPVTVNVTVQSGASFDRGALTQLGGLLGPIILKQLYSSPEWRVIVKTLTNSWHR